MSCDIPHTLLLNLLRPSSGRGDATWRIVSPHASAQFVPPSRANGLDATWWMATPLTHCCYFCLLLGPFGAREHTRQIVNHRRRRHPTNRHSSIILVLFASPTIWRKSHQPPNRATPLTFLLNLLLPDHLVRETSSNELCSERDILIPFYSTYSCSLPTET